MSLRARVFFWACDGLARVANKKTNETPQFLRERVFFLMYDWWIGELIKLDKDSQILSMKDITHIDGKKYLWEAILETHNHQRITVRTLPPVNCAFLSKISTSRNRIALHQSVRIAGGGYYVGTVYRQASEHGNSSLIWALSRSASIGR